MAHQGSTLYATRRPPLESLIFSGVEAAHLFVPAAKCVALRRLREELWRRNQAKLVSAQQLIETHFSSQDPDGAFWRVVTVYLRRPIGERCRQMEAPATRSGLYRLLRLIGAPRDDFNRPPRGLGPAVADLTRLLDGGETGRSVRSARLPCVIYRHDVDPVLRRAIPPSFVFTNKARRRDEASPYRLDFFQSVVESAMDRIAAVWPAAARAFPMFVKAIVHLPRADFRSCSADRYAGLILLSAHDHTLFAVEESLIHEFAHQVLYAAMELGPLVRSRDRKGYVLPWSGSRRDAYGYFHALYVYFLLSVYFDRALAAPCHEHDEVAARLSKVLIGLLRALSDFRRGDMLTERGRLFLTNLDTWAGALLARHATLVRH